MTRQPQPVQNRKRRNAWIFLRVILNVTLTFGMLGNSSCAKEEADKPVSQLPTKTSTEGPAKREYIAIQHVPVGTFQAGSLPGEPGRDPSLEPTQIEVKLGPFRIDTLPYPGDPTQEPRLGVKHAEAGTLCAERNGRLCTELEWERACRGPSSSMYAGGNVPCDENKESGACSSGFDVVSMGSIAEWTSSSFGKDSPLADRPVARGASTGLSPAERRCSRRFNPKKQTSVGFRCCYGAPNAARLSEPQLGRPYKEIQLSDQELQQMLSSHPRTEKLAAGARFFKIEAAQTVLARGPGDTKGFTLTTNAVQWQPARGSRFLVVAGSTGNNTSFVVAYFLSKGKKELAGSFIMQHEPGPIALAYADSIRPRIHFSNCWGCPGETGKVLFRPPEELVFLQP